MQRAYLLLEVNPGSIEKVAGDINNSSIVVHSDIIEGNMKIVVLVEGKNKYELAEAVDYILLTESDYINDSSVFPVRSEIQTRITGMLSLF
ncbi:MAG: hypothetical protein JW915_08000 [Chitinispirillaceae bacterium]|nr:hypothetical protein [Chitinispirillaceae bacterium]